MKIVQTLGKGVVWLYLFSNILSEDAVIRIQTTCFSHNLLLLLLCYETKVQKFVLIFTKTDVNAFQLIFHLYHSHTSCFAYHLYFIPPLIISSNKIYTLKHNFYFIMKILQMLNSNLLFFLVLNNSSNR